MYRYLIMLLIIFPLQSSAQWTKTNFPLNKSVNTIKAFDQDLYIGTDNGLFKSTNAGVSWDSIGGITVSEIRAIVKMKNNLFIGTNGGVFRSTDNGKTWFLAMYGTNEYNVFALESVDTTLFAGMNGGGGVYRSTNYGVIWQSLPAPIDGNLVNDLFFDGVILFAATGNGVYVSSDSGTSWVQRNTGMVNKQVYSVVKNGVSLFAGTNGGGVYFSANNGTNWSAVNTGLSDLHVYSLCANGTYLFAGVFTSGVFRSTNNGTSWSAINTGLISPTVKKLAVYNSFLMAGMTPFSTFSNGGLWIRPFSEVMAAETNKEQSPGQFALHQNFPNPFNPSTTIGFEIPSDSRTVLIIHDILGRKIATIVDRVLLKGEYSFIWNAGQFSSGIYFYRLHSGSFTVTNKLLLQK